jgi:hypothetical protein
MFLGKALIGCINGLLSPQDPSLAKGPHTNPLRR